MDRKVKDAEHRLSDIKAKVAEQEQQLVNKQNEYDALLQKAESNVDLEQRVQERRQELDSEIQEREALLAKKMTSLSSFNNMRIHKQLL